MGQAPAELLRTMRDSSTFMFIARLALFGLPIFVLSALSFRIPALEHVTATLVAMTLSALGATPTQMGTFVAVPIANGSWGAFITWDCTGWKSVLALIALVCATPAAMHSRVRAFALFIPVIFVANLFRIVALFLLVQNGGLAVYPEVHAIIWSFGMLAVVLSCWILWLVLARKTL